MQLKVILDDSTIHYVKMMNIYFGMKYDTAEEKITALRDYYQSIDKSKLTDEELQNLIQLFNDMTSKLAIKISGVGG